LVQQKTLRDIQKAIKPQISPLDAGIELPARFRSNDFWDGGVSSSQDDGQVIEVKPSRGLDESMVGATRWQKKKKLEEKKQAEEQKQRALSEKSKKGKGKGKKKASFWGKTTVEEEEKPLSVAARRKKIKDHLIAAGEGETPQGYRRKWY